MNLQTRNVGIQHTSSATHYEHTSPTHNERLTCSSGSLISYTPTRDSLPPTSSLPLPSASSSSSSPTPARPDPSKFSNSSAGKQQFKQVKNQNNNSPLESPPPEGKKPTTPSSCPPSPPSSSSRLRRLFTAWFTSRLCTGKKEIQLKLHSLHTRTQSLGKEGLQSLYNNYYDDTHVPMM